jgi:hypothetical protein
MDQIELFYLGYTEELTARVMPICKIARFKTKIFSIKEKSVRLTDTFK